jgi:hypothetical protein
VLHKWLSEQGRCAIVTDYRGDWDLLVDAMWGLPWAQNVHNKPVYVGEFLHSDVFELAVAEYWGRHPERKEHHALWDAHANRAGWLAMPMHDRRQALLEYGLLAEE